MGRRPALLLLAVAAGFGAVAVRAAPPEGNSAAVPLPAGADIVVTGKKQSYARIVAALGALVRSPEGVLPRFERPVCPLALGLAAPLARAVEREMAEAARQVGVRVAPPGCRPNLTLVVANDGVGAIRAIQRRMPNLFQTLSGAQLTALKRGTGPVWSWYEYEQKRRDGGPVEHAALLEGNPPKLLSPHAYINRNVQMSRLTQPIRLDLMLAFVVVDSRSAEGLRARQLAAAAAAMGLAMVRAGQVAKLSEASALQLLVDPAARQRIDGLTAFDRAFLSTLYSGDPGAPAEARAAQIAARAVGRLPMPHGAERVVR